MLVLISQKYCPDLPGTYSFSDARIGASTAMIRQLFANKNLQ